MIEFTWNYIEEMMLHKVPITSAVCAKFIVMSYSVSGHLSEGEISFSSRLKTGNFTNVLAKLPKFP